MGRALVMWLGGVLTCGGFEILHHKNTQPILNWKYPQLALVNETPKLGSQEAIGGSKTWPEVYISHVFFMWVSPPIIQISCVRSLLLKIKFGQLCAQT